MRLFSKVYPHWVFWTVPERVWAPKPCSFDWCDRSMPCLGVVRLAGPGLVVRAGPESGSGGLGRGTHVVWALTAPEHGTSDTCSLIAWTIDLLSNILREGRLLQRLKQLKIINHRVNKTMHSTALSQSASLPPSHAIGNVLFPTYEVMIMSSLHSNYLFFVERIM